MTAEIQNILHAVLIEDDLPTAIGVLVREIATAIRTMPPDDIGLFADALTAAAVPLSRAVLQGTPAEGL